MDHGISAHPYVHNDPSRGEGQINDIRDVQTSKETRRATRLPDAAAGDAGGNDAVQVTRARSPVTVRTESD